jgi:hypothetical protein
MPPAFAWRALSAFWLTDAVSCSIAAAVCSSDPAWDFVREDRSALPAAISREASPIASVPSRT